MNKSFCFTVYIICISAYFTASNIYICMCVCVCARVCACVRACVRVCVCVRESANDWRRANVLDQCARIYEKWNRYNISIVLYHNLLTCTLYFKRKCLYICLFTKWMRKKEGYTSLCKLCQTWSRVKAVLFKHAL